MSFTPEEKIKAFDRLGKMYYERNFGLLSKADFELMMFDFYLEHLLDSANNFDDYTISKALGITQNRVRNLKLRKQLKYPRAGYEWKIAFADCVKNAHYDESSCLLKMNIPDINVLTDLRYFMESNGWYDEYQLNPKLFQCKLEFFLKMCSEMDEIGIVQFDKQAEAKLKELSEYTENDKVKNAIQKILVGSLEDGLKELVLNAGKSVIGEVLKLIPFGTFAKPVVDALIQVLVGT